MTRGRPGTPADRALGHPRGGPAAATALVTPMLAFTVVELEVLEAAHLEAAPSPGPVHVQAAQSLRARGLLTEDGRLATDEPAGSFVQLLLDVRLVAPTVVLVSRQTSRDRCSRTFFVAPGLITVEDAAEDGRRSLALLLSVAEAESLVAEMLVPPGAVDGSEGDVVLVRDADAAPWEDTAAGLDALPWEGAAELSTLGLRLGHPTVLAELTLLREMDGGLVPVEQRLLALGRRGCYEAHRIEGEPSLRFQPVTTRQGPERVGAWMRAGWDTGQPGAGVGHSPGAGVG